MLVAYRFALDPTPAQVRALRSHAGAARVAFNWGLARVKANLSQREAERSYGLTGDELTPSVSWTLYSMRKAWNQAKDDVAPWWGECSKEAFNTGLDQLCRALKNWSDSKNGKRKGRRMGFPRFRSKRMAVPSIRWTTGAFRCESGHAVLPRVGRVKLHEDGRRLADLVAAGGARVMSAAVRFERGRWFVSFTADHFDDVVRHASSELDAVVGVDLGIKTLATVSGGHDPIGNPKHLRTAERKIRRRARRLSRRKGPDRRTGQAPSNRWERARKALADAHARVADLRGDHMHKATTDLTGRFGTIVLEDLNVAGMTKNKRLAKPSLMPRSASSAVRSSTRPHGAAGGS